MGVPARAHGPDFWPAFRPRNLGRFSNARSGVHPGFRTNCGLTSAPKPVPKVGPYSVPETWAASKSWSTFWGTKLDRFLVAARAISEPRPVHFLG